MFKPDIIARVVRLPILRLFIVVNAYLLSSNVIFFHLISESLGLKNSAALLLMLSFILTLHSALGFKMLGLDPI